MSVAPRLRLVEASFFERPVRLRLPFRFGVVTLREAPQAFTRVRIRLADGREGEGVAAQLLVPKWFDKSQDLTNEQNFDQLRRSLAIARDHFLAVGENTPYGLSLAVEPAHRDACTAAKLNGLVASFGLAEIERAVLDALARLEAAPACDLVSSNRIGLTSQAAPDLAGFDLDRFLSGLTPAPSIYVRHTVGMVDALTRAETVGHRLDDGLPESLEEVVETYGHRHFKLKVSGDAAADIARLAGIAAVIDHIPEPYVVTLDGNEQYDTVEAVVALWRRMKEEPRLARLVASTLHVEQPIGRARALAEPVHALAGLVPVEVDESDSDLDVFPKAHALGYRGISAKSCKGFYRALLNRARVDHWNATAGAQGVARCFMSAEDLTTQAGIAVQQDLALATLVGVTHVERNGHHYVDGMAGAPEHEQARFLAAHPDLYSRSDGRARLAIRNGAVSLASLGKAPGLALGAEPDWASMRPMAV
ncbi:mandelate racemase [Rhodoplanes roseus]|uniref:Mandelate racemase n=1 Tax=Rhodoplanes roseus TaxID=29409 RepID=A0A327KWV8_9BRAD|nr:mandelate racemase [Rhodoplanes roseus]RAI42143.1 mandelate racemase [Rhodoplanes roseus]